MYQTNYQTYLIQGSEAESFLQGQFSCDIAEIKKTPTAGAYCLPDGKILGFFYLYYVEQGYLLITNDDNADNFLKRLKMFILRADVQIQKTNHIIYGCDTRDATTEQTSNAIAFIELNNNLSIFFNINENLDANNSDDVQPVEYWNYLETLNGLPMINDQLRGKFILPFINLDWLGAVSYQKGCYVGQEVIARLYYRSKPAKRSYIYSADQELHDLTLAEPISCTDGEGKPCRVTPIRIALWQNKVALIVEMATRNAPRDQLIIAHKDREFSLSCEPQPY